MGISVLQTVGLGFFTDCCLSCVSEVWSFCIDVYGVKMKCIIMGNKAVALCCMLDQSYIMQLNNYLLNILMKLPFAYMCGTFVELFPFSFSVQDLPLFSRTATHICCGMLLLLFHCIKCNGQLELCPPGAGGTDRAPRWERSCVLKPLIPETTEPKALPECSHSTGLGE